MPSDFHFKCPSCGKKAEYVKSLSAPKYKMTAYICWSCELVFKVNRKQEKMYDVDIFPLVRT